MGGSRDAEHGLDSTYREFTIIVGVGVLHKLVISEMKLVGSDLHGACEGVEERRGAAGGLGRMVEDMGRYPHCVGMTPIKSRRYTTYLHINTTVGLACGVCGQQSPQHESLRTSF